MISLMENLVMLNLSRLVSWRFLLCMRESRFNIMRDIGWETKKII